MLDENNKMDDDGLMDGVEGFSPLGVTQVFNDFGIRLVSYSGLSNANKFYYGDKQISHEKALQIVREALKNNNY